MQLSIFTQDTIKLESLIKILTAMCEHHNEVYVKFQVVDESACGNEHQISISVDQ